MLNFLVTDITQLLPTQYFQYIIQFETQLEADIWFIENGITTDELPFYKKGMEVTPFEERNLATINIFLNNFNLQNLILVETSSYKALCFTEKSSQIFAGNVIQGSTDEKLEFTKVDRHYIYGFANPPER